MNTFHSLCFAALISSLAGCLGEEAQTAGGSGGAAGATCSALDAGAGGSTVKECAGDANCLASEVCILLKGAAVGTCRPRCVVPNDCKEAGSVCQPANGASSNFCTAPCDPRHPGAPTNGYGPCSTQCYRLSSAGVWHCSVPAGAGTQGSPCTTSAECAPGFGCEGGQQCRMFCTVGGNECSCVGAKTCVDDVLAGTAHVGVCY